MTQTLLGACLDLRYLTLSPYATKISFYVLKAKLLFINVVAEIVFDLRKYK